MTDVFVRKRRHRKIQEEPHGEGSRDGDCASISQGTSGVPESWGGKEGLYLGVSRGSTILLTQTVTLRAAEL